MVVASLGAPLALAFAESFVTITVDAAGARSEASGMDPMERLLGAAEVRRNSTEMVEYAFDGDLAEVRALLEKGYHMDSTDGRKHTPLSDAAAQGHADLAQFLIGIGRRPQPQGAIEQFYVGRLSAGETECTRLECTIEAVFWRAYRDTRESGT